MSAEPDSEGMSRRDLLRRGTAAGIAVGGVSTGAVRLDHGPVQEAQAVLPAVAGLVAVGGTGWLLRDQEIIGSDTPTEGTDFETLQANIVNTLEARKDTNGETITDNVNIVKGIEHVAYSDGKIAATEALNDQKSEQEVLDAAHDAAFDHLTTVQENFYSTWNQSMEELLIQHDALDDHPDGGDASLIPLRIEGNGGETAIENLDRNDEERTLADGSTIEVKTLTGGSEELAVGGTTNWVNWRNDLAEKEFDTFLTDSETALMRVRDWNEVLDIIDEAITEVEGGLEMWVQNVYEDVQAGELDTAELLTPRELAEITSEDEEFPQAASDLMALNVAVDLEREAEVYLPEIEATIYGSLATTGDESLSVGEVDPSERDDDIYLTYDISQGQGTWSAYETGVDGGTVTFTAQPFDQTLYSLTTTDGEIVEFTTDDLEETDEGGEWTVDLSSQLDDQITEVESIEYFSETSETQNETILLQDPFEIIDFTDSDGESYEQSSFERTQTHDNENYITEEEWQEQRERHEELIQQYEDAQGGIAIPGVEDVLSGEANGFIGMVVVGGFAVITVLSALNPAS